MDVLCNTLYSNESFEFHLELQIGSFLQSLKEQLLHFHQEALFYVSATEIEILK